MTYFLLFCFGDRMRGHDDVEGGQAVVTAAAAGDDARTGKRDWLVTADSRAETGKFLESRAATGKFLESRAAAAHVSSRPGPIFKWGGRISGFLFDFPSFSTFS